MRRSFVPCAKNFLFDNYGIIVIFMLLVVVYFSSSNFLTRPKIWVDEANTIEQSRNLSRYGTPDIEVAPGTFSGVPFLIQSTGYPVTAPLALVFKVFGYGFTQARVYMLVWLMMALLLVWYTARKFFGSTNALFSFLLIATFASFYGSGLTVVGEIPGFVFLLTGLLYIRKESYGIAGLLWGLAIVTKPSVFELIIPAILIALLIERTAPLKKIGMLLSGMIPAAVLWFVVVVHGIPTTKVFGDILNFYLNTYGTSTSLNITNNLQAFFHTPTLMYFALLLAVIGIARYVISTNEEYLQKSKIILLYDFTILYSLLAFLYYLRSPGWLRYILIAELLILFLLPHATSVFVERFAKKFSIGPIHWKKIWVVALTILLIVQTTHFMIGAKIFYSRSALDTAAFLDEHFPNDSVAIYNSLALAVLLDRKMRYQVVGSDVIPLYSTREAFVDPKPLLVQPPIDLIVSLSGHKFSSNEDSILKNTYTVVYDDNEYVAYRLKSLSLK